MKDCTLIVDTVITNIKTEMALANKHAIKTQTIWNRTLNIIKLSESTIHVQLEKEGLAQVIERRLHARGYRSVRPGYFVNLDECWDIPYLIAMSENADNSAEERKMAADRVKEIKNERMSGQISFNEDGELIIPMCEEEFMKKLEEDAA